jgi:glycerol-3-phosphate acyltransferase PlsY
MVYGIIAVVLGYLLGSIPTAYIVTRLAKGEDVRRLGGGNVGGLNVYREVGLLPAVVVAVVDLGKGAAAVAMAYWLLDLSVPFVLAAALAAVVGHNWMVWLKFSGGKGMGAAIGGLFVLLPIYGYPLGLAFFSAVVLVLFITTRNVALSMGAGLLALPFIAWLGMQSIPEQTEFIISV